MKNWRKLWLLPLLMIGNLLQAQEHTVAREWNEELLFAITNDIARPTVHARNLFHISAAMYDAWAAYDQNHDCWLLGQTRGEYTCAFDGVAIPQDAETLKAYREEAISFAAYRLLIFRFQNSFAFSLMMPRINALMDEKGYNRFNTDTAYINGGPAELGNYIAQQMIFFGQQDGSNEPNDFNNQFYVPVNDSILVDSPGNPTLSDPNRWQAISLATGQLGQAGDTLTDTPPHLSPEWGYVVPFAMTDADKVILERDGFEWPVYHDPGPVALIDTTEHIGLESQYKWGFTMVSVWQSHLDPDDDTMWDISPGGMGNVNYEYPESWDEYADFYDFFEGGDPGQGHPVNPATGMPYEPQIVKRADYARILAEYWADGPDSYTPPGHWYEIINRALFDHPDFEYKWMGEGEELDKLEYEVKMYFTLGGTMHDVAVSAWSVKGYYDYLRPVSAIRWMCERGQCTDSTASNYHPAGMPLIPGYVETVEEGDPLAGDDNENVGKIKLYTWRGPDFITYQGSFSTHPLDYAGVGWILGENWWPYQRPSFVTPPFAGYVSGHSTYSSAAASALEMMTGDAFFPGGMAEFVAEQEEFLEFEVGPSETISLQWATYRDASDQCSLSRIWGGIHPPVDDIPGRFMGMVIGPDAVNFANTLFNTDRPVVEDVTSNQPVYNINDIGSTLTLSIAYDQDMDTDVVPSIEYMEDNPLENSLSFISAEWVNSMVYELQYEVLNGNEKLDNIVIRIDDANNEGGNVQNVYLAAHPFVIDTDRPVITDVAVNQSLLNDQLADEGSFVITITVNEECDMDILPIIEFDSPEDLSSTLIYSPANSQWLNPTTFEVHFDLNDNDEEIEDIGITVLGIHDAAGNEQEPFDIDDLFSIDTKNPLLDDLTVNQPVLNIQSINNNALFLDWYFDEPMNTSLAPSFSFPNDNPMGTSLALNSFSSGWQNNTHYRMAFNLLPPENEFFDIVLVVSNFRDLAGNSLMDDTHENLFIIDTKRPSVADMQPSSTIISDSDVGSSGFQVVITYDEPMNQSQAPVVSLSSDVTISNSISFNFSASEWLDDTTFEARFNVIDQNVEVEDINITVGFAQDAAGNSQNSLTLEDWIDLDTRNPELLVLSANTYLVTDMHTGDAGLTFLMIFDETMDQNEQPEMQFAGPVNLDNTLVLNTQESVWINAVSHQVAYDVAEDELQVENIDVLVVNARDMAGNEVVPVNFSDYFSINITSVGVTEYGRDLGISAFPNPVQSGAAINLKLSEPIDRAVVQLLSATGQTVWQRDEARMEAGLHLIPMSGQASGMYFLRIQTADSSQIIRIAVVD